MQSCKYLSPFLYTILKIPFASYIFSESLYSSLIFDPSFWWEHLPVSVLRKVSWEVKFLKSWMFVHVFFLPSFLIDKVARCKNWLKSCSLRLLKTLLHCFELPNVALTSLHPDWRSYVWYCLFPHLPSLHLFFVPSIQTWVFFNHLCWAWFSH